MVKIMTATNHPSHIRFTTRNRASAEAGLEGTFKGRGVQAGQGGWVGEHGGEAVRLAVFTAEVQRCPPVAVPGGGVSSAPQQALHQLLLLGDRGQVKGRLGRAGRDTGRTGVRKRKKTTSLLKEGPLVKVSVHLAVNYLAKA